MDQNKIYQTQPMFWLGENKTVNNAILIADKVTTCNIAHITKITSQQHNNRGMICTF